MTLTVEDAYVCACVKPGDVYNSIRAISGNSGCVWHEVGDVGFVVEVSCDVYVGSACIAGVDSL